MNTRAAIVETSVLHADALQQPGMYQLLREFTRGREAVHLTHVTLLSAGALLRQIHVSGAPRAGSAAHALVNHAAGYEPVLPPLRRLAVAALAHYPEHEFAQVCFKAAVEMVDLAGAEAEVAAADAVYLLAGLIGEFEDPAAVARFACACGGEANARTIAEMEAPYRLARALLAGDVDGEQQQLGDLLKVCNPTSAVTVLLGMTARFADVLELSPADLAGPGVDPVLDGTADELIGLMRARLGTVDGPMRTVAERLVREAELPEVALSVAAAKLAAALRVHALRNGDAPTGTVDRMIGHMYRVPGRVS
jgi:hypothetical protein